MARSPITDSLKRVNEAIAYLQNTLNPGEIDLLLDELAPLPEQPQPPAPKKRTRKKGGGSGASKSKRATGMAAAIGGSMLRSRAAAIENVDAEECDLCSRPADDNVHHLASTKDYHPLASVSPARNVAPSSMNGGATGSTASSGDEQVSAQGAAGGSTGG